MKRIYSGLYVHPSSQPATWAGRALSRHLRWCQQQAIEYTFIASPMNAWAKHAAYPWSWTFGTLVKFEAMRDFLDNPSRGNVFIWMDLDVYPEADAKLDDITQFGSNVLSAPLVPPSYCGYPEVNRAHLNMYCKLLWTSRHNQPEYFAMNTGMFSLSRANVKRFWAWLNRDHNIDSADWWQEHNARQLRCKAIASDLDTFGFGSHEAIMEDWLNSSRVIFREFGFDVHGLYDSGQQHKFTHYYGSAKDRYPTG